jgi:P-type conjugative transfer protein TrbJ
MRRALAIALACIPWLGFAQQVVIDPTNLEQNTVNTLTGIKNLSNQVQQLTTQGRLLEESVKAGTAVAPEVWAELDRSIAASAQQGSALIVSANQLDAAYRRLFPGVGRSDKAQVVLDTIQGVLSAFHAAQQAAIETQTRLEILRRANDRAPGQLAATQTANALASLNAELLSRVQESIALQTNAMAVAEARRVQQEESERAASDQSRASMPRSIQYRPQRDLLQRRTSR